MRLALLASGLVACQTGPTPTPTRGPAPPDLTEVLGPGQVRAGVVTDDDALFAGISAEGQQGDVKIYNDRVQFVIQGLREGSFYVPQAGHVIDADIVRPAGQPGRDMVDEWLSMAGLGRLVQAEVIEVVSDGSDGAAVVRVEGWESALELFSGAVESDMLTDYGLRLTTEFRLLPESWLLEVTTTVQASDLQAKFTPGDGILGSADAAELWLPGGGYDGSGGQQYPFAAWIGKRNEAALGVFLNEGVLADAGGLEALSGLLDLAATFQDSVTVEPGDSYSWRRWYGVGPDLATLTDAHQSKLAHPTDRVTGTVSAPDGPVPGARVAVLVDGVPQTLAFTDDQGRFEVSVPAGSEATVLADGRGQALHPDLPAGAASWSPYAAAPAREQVLESLATGAVPLALATGRGAADPADPLVLGEPGWLEVRAADAATFEVLVRLTEADVDVDRRIVRSRPSGHIAAAWAADGAVRFPVEPGTFDVLVHRGARHGYHLERVTVAPGAEARVEASLPLQVAHEGYLFGDPHAHASPSPDGGLPMEDRLLVHAGTGVQVHFGTDHDHIADYRPLIAPLGLEGILATVVASEMSPVMRGHVNAYPLPLDETLPNNGAWPWWRDRVQSTDEQFETLRSRYGGDLAADGAVLQVNHPVGVGLVDLANWVPGRIDRPDFWTEDFDAMELLNGGSYADYLPVYNDLVARGLRFTPVGVTDTHKYFSSGTGLNGTYIGMGLDDPGAYSDEALREAFVARRTVVSRGVFLAMSVDPGAEVSGSTTVDVEARSADWIHVDRLVLWRDGAPIETVEGGTATFDLAPERDAFYTVEAQGDTRMDPVYGTTPWAMSSAIFVDVAGDGWDPPLPPLELGSPAPVPAPDGDLEAALERLGDGHHH